MADTADETPRHHGPGLGDREARGAIKGSVNKPDTLQRQTNVDLGAALLRARTL